MRSTLLEREAAAREYSRASGILTRTREVFRAWSVEERILDASFLARRLTVHNAQPDRRPFFSLDFSELDDEADNPGIVLLEQSRTEELLLEAVRESGMCDVRIGAEAVGLVHGDDGAVVRYVAGGQEHRLDATYVVGCDGASSFVRGALELPFEGGTYTMRPMLADVRVGDDRDSLPWPQMRNAPRGLTFMFRIRPRLWRLVCLERGAPRKGEQVGPDEVQRRVAETIGEGPVEIVWASRFRIHRRASPRFRIGHVLLAGDAAHVHSPVGGLGMNGGVQDAHNLAWKLASTLAGGDADRLLDSYDVERRAVMVGSVSRYTNLLTRIFLQTPPAVRQVGFAAFRPLVKIERVRRADLRRRAMIDLDYPRSPILNPRERSAGIRLPNPLLRSPRGDNVRLYDLLPTGSAILDVAEDRDFVPALPIEHVIQIGRAGYLDTSGLLREVVDGRDGWILVRPDAHVAWARHHLDGIGEAVTHALGERP